MIAAVAPGGNGGGAPVTRQGGQQLARTELSKAIYHPGISLGEGLTTRSTIC